MRFAAAQLPPALPVRGTSVASVECMLRGEAGIGFRSSDDKQTAVARSKVNAPACMSFMNTTSTNKRAATVQEDTAAVAVWRTHR